MSDHPAVRKAQELWAARAEDGTMRPLTVAEDVFLRRVTIVLWCTIKSRRWAKALCTEGSGAYVASCDLAQRQEQHDLTAALESYERHLEPCP